jgi:hypothetical protein
MTAQVDLGDLDAVFPDDPIPPRADPVCAVCETPLEWSGKGFRPKYCADHKRGKGQPAASKAEKTTATKATRNNPQVNRAVDSIRMIYALTGTALNRTIAPTIGAEVFNNSDRLAESYRMLLETNKQVRDWFAQAEGKAAWLPILVVHADLALNIALAGQRQGTTDSPGPESPTWEPDLYGVPTMPPRPDGA